MIQTEAELKALVQRAVNAPRVALDTEFFWERTFYPILGVVQLGFSERECVLIDAIALPTLPYFGDLLSCPSTEKILHDAKQDLVILSHITKTTPKSIFDTRCAAGFTGLPSTTSLAALLREVMDVDIPKTETRSNWLKRPLTQNQIDYALNDVRFLPGLRDLLSSRAEALGNLAYLQEEMERFNPPDFYNELTPLDIFSRIKSGRLQGQNRIILLELVRFREAAARTYNIPRAHVLRDTDLLELAHHAPSSMGDIERLRDLPRGTAQRYGQPILTAIYEGRSASKIQNSLAPEKKRPPRDLKDKVNQRILSIKKAGIAAGIDPALIASKGMVTEWISAELEDPKLQHPLQMGWRKNFLSPAS